MTTLDDCLLKVGRAEPQSPGRARPPASPRSHRMTSDTAGSVSSTSAAVPWARIGEHVGQRNPAVTANTYSHVLADETELDYAEALTF